MRKIKKIKGGFSLFVTEDEKYLVTTNSRNSVYVYDLKTRKLKFQTKTLSNVSKKVISPDRKVLAVKNTRGHMALILMETGEEIGRTKMEEREGKQMTFTSDGKFVIDFDRDGRTMILNCETMSHEILDGPSKRYVSELPRVAHMQYDRYSNQIYKIIADSFGCSAGRIMVSSLDPNNIDYKVIREFPDKIPDFLYGFSLCKAHNYYVDKQTKEFVVTDKQFKEVKRIKLPKQIDKDNSQIYKMWVSPCERYIFIIMLHYDINEFTQKKDNFLHFSYLFDLDTMELVQEFDYPYTSDFTMINEDKTFIISTWEGTYIGDI